VFISFVAVVVVQSKAENIAANLNQYDDAGTFNEEAMYYITAAWDESAVYSGRVSSTIDVGNDIGYTTKLPGMLDSITYTNQPLRSNQDYCIFVRYDILNENPGESVVCGEINKFYVNLLDWMWKHCCIIIEYLSNFLFRTLLAYFASACSESVSVA